MKSVALLLTLVVSCGGAVEIDDSDTGVITYENVDCADLLPCLCRTCGQSCEMCGDHDGWLSCSFCLDTVENTGDCTDLVDACL
jgi:hypothetical protein